MTSFTVEWDAPAENELAQIYLDASDPASVTRAQARVDRLLAANPAGNGELLSEGLYRIEVEPPIVNYTIDNAQHHVQVTWVRSSS